MDVDVYGKIPSSKVGQYFCNSIGWWNPLWSYCEKIAPDLIPTVNLGHSRNGWGLTDDASRTLSGHLMAAIESGHTKRYADRYRKKLEALPLEPCTICGATGKRTEPPRTGPGEMHCNGCNGLGQALNPACHYPFEVENVQAFAEFLRDCGGFEIH
ncbi:hypothetical protein M5G25_11115 [Pseudomonas sp. TNT2022 ID357]|uniref:Uncharacterized protein n=1 Tax=Pseudomonas idahonensis TaxID=2942628 RepID=A0ABT5Q3U6_9PSED|nr:hypothetical protein [Pseudomonas idahonensis]MDD1148842.1 hypothetical protein [Pseudomonas idahonensis]